MANKSDSNSPVTIFISALVPWLLRLAAHEESGYALGIDPVAFSAWYAVMGDAMPWPEEVINVRNAEQSKQLSLEQITKLLQQVNYTFDSRTSSAHARKLLEGYAVHEWVQPNLQAFQDMATAKLAQLKEREGLLADVGGKHMTAFERRLSELGEVLSLTPLEHELLTFAFLMATSPEIAAVYSQLVKDRWTAERLWTITFNASREDLAEALRAESPLRLSGLLRASEYDNSFASVSHLWVELLVREASLEEALVEPFTAKTGSGIPAQMDAADMGLAVSILEGAKEPGVNLLLYGAPGLDKRYLVTRLAITANRQPYRLRKFDDASRLDRPSLAYVAQRVLADRSESAMLVVDRPTDVLEAVPSSFMRAFFGIDPNLDDMRPFDERILDTNVVPTLWLASSTELLPDDTVTRFVFHAPLKKADKQTRQAQMEEVLHGLDLSEAVREAILKLESVSASQIEAALKAARLAGQVDPALRDQAILQAVRRSQRALGRDLQAKRKQSDTKYSLEYLNTVGRFGPEQVLTAFRREARGSVVLYGPPGTGKTQFVEYLATELGKPLVAKKASELISKYVGDSEKAIAAAFEEAMAEDAILFFDEGDSFLRDRNRARESWEVTRVNEMLQHIERFEGIVIIGTNLFSGLDTAALRRFSFKIEFRALLPAQRWSMFVNEAKLDESTVSPAQKEVWLDKLTFMTQLTPGDFAVVQQQCRILGIVLSPEEWLEQLQLECDLKYRG